MIYVIKRLSKDPTNYITVETRAVNSAAGLEVRVIYKDDATDQWDDTVDGTITTTFVKRPPSISYLLDSWGAPAFAETTNTQA